MVAKKRFSQATYDKLVTNKARSVQALRKARREVETYVRTHTSGIARKRRGETWV